MCSIDYYSDTRIFIKFYSAADITQQIYSTWQSMREVTLSKFLRETRSDRVSSRNIQGQRRTKADTHVNPRHFRRRRRRRQRNFLAPFNPVSRINCIAAAACPSEVTSVLKIYKCVLLNTGRVEFAATRMIHDTLDALRISVSWRFFLLQFVLI